jgi:electron transport complex protein RnfE
MSIAREFSKGFWRENPIFRLVLGLCPTLAVTTAAINGIGMGLATTFVLVCSNIVISLLRRFIPPRVRIPSFIVISLLRRFIPPRVRIPSFIVVIASFVTIVDLVMAGFFFQLHKTLGLFIPLIVVNCIILGRAEAFASKRPFVDSVADGFGMGFGFTLSLVVLGAIREILGNGTLFGLSAFGPGYFPFLVMILPPGAFITLGFLLALMNRLADQRPS